VFVANQYILQKNVRDFHRRTGQFFLGGLKKYFFFILLAGFCPKNLAFARKIMVLPESGGGLQPPSPPGSYAYGDFELLWLQEEDSLNIRCEHFSLLTFCHVLFVKGRLFAFWLFAG